MIKTDDGAQIPKLVAEMQAIREEAGVTLEEMLADLAEDRLRRNEESLASDRSHHRPPPRAADATAAGDDPYHGPLITDRSMGS